MIFQKLGHLYRVAHSVVRENLKARSPHWHTTRKLYLSLHPTCEACGSGKALQVHHCIPFELALSLGKPELELDLKNLICLCMSKYECHLNIGHAAKIGGGWHHYNPHVREDAAVVLADHSKRAQIEIKAYNMRKPIP